MPRTTVNREHFIQLLEFVQPGLSPREIIEQSSCFVFSKEGFVQTFNDEIACCHESPLQFTGAVQAKPLLDLLHKLPEPEIDIEDTKEELRVYGKRRTAGIRMEEEVTLPVEHVEQPKVWKDLPEEFPEAVKLVHQCCSKDESAVHLTCVHIHPKWIEACDNSQIARYRLKTGVEAPILVRGKSIRHVMDLGVTEFSETETWLHFRNASGLVFSIRRHLEDYVNLAPFLKVAGAKMTLPKGLIEAAEKADIFSSENADDNLVTVTLRAGKLKLEGRGVSGWYRETKKVAYEGAPLTFLISPELLGEIVKRTNECEVTEERLKVDGGRWTYVSCLSKTEANGEVETQEEG